MYASNKALAKVNKKKTLQVTKIKKYIHRRHWQERERERGE